MERGRSLSVLAARRWWIYGGGLAVILALRLQFVEPRVRLLVVSVVLGVMVLTYAAELWHAGGEGIASPTLLGLGFAGVVAGFWSALSGTPPGLLFAGGGLLFLKRAMSGSMGESA